VTESHPRPCQDGVKEGKYASRQCKKSMQSKHAKNELIYLIN
jgi:hypothetical protein